ncbi:alpha/beta hydrolase [Naasia sp. SYSU D00948]|uniref:alpha/beta hydrolase n=1 Tax=Naasia sp. SYSU D00948 TaxID=2817379 RepID=UPI001B3049AD|nr:alpha/beta hydrolase [Naasia sp. SYSU D00948]
MKSLRLLAAAAVALLAVPLAGCIPQPGATSTPTAEEVEARYERYYTQVLTWEDCGNEMQCATAFAPLDWSAPDEVDDIELALVRHRATGEREGSLFVNPGGPGASGFDFVYDSVDFAVSDELQRRFDVIGWDPRGVGRSSAVDCYSDQELDEFLFGVPAAPVGSEEYVQEVTASAKDFADACAERTGELLQFIDTASTVRDLDMLRAVVGDSALNYIGYSYGSDIGAQYADRFAGKVGRVVLDGATDPTVSLFEVDLAQTQAFGDALRAYLTDCLGSSACPFRGGVDDAIVQIREILDRLDEAPLRAEDGRRLNSAYLGTAINMALYDEGTWQYLTQAFTEIQQGRSETAFLLADAYVDRDEEGRYASNIMEAFLAITCIDYPVETDPAELARQRDLLAEVDPLAEPEDLDALGNVVCQQWPYSFEGEIGPVTAEGSAPILVVGTTGDPATPYEWAESLVGQLESGVLLTYVGEGHIAYDEGDPCIVGAVDEYLINGTVPQDGLVCDRA